MMIGFRYKQQLPLIRLYRVFHVQSLSKNLVSLELIGLELVSPLIADRRYWKKYMFFPVQQFFL